MSDTKLMVMQKKIIKLLRTSLPKYVKQKIFLFGIKSSDSKNFRNRGLLSKQQRPKLRKISQSVYRNLFRRKEKPIGKVFINISRYLSVSLDTDFGQYSRVTSFWKALLPQMSKDEKRLNTIWIKATNEMTVPKFSRGISGRQSGSSGSRKPSDASLGKADKMDLGIPNQPSEQYSEIAEQKFYTGALSTDKSTLNLKREREKAEENWSEVIPPPHKCRLSCPLPPAEFYPPEANEFYSNYQSPNRRLSALPKEFSPKQKPTAQNSDDNYITRTTEQFPAKNGKSFTPTPSPSSSSSSSSRSLNFLELTQKNIKNKKNYLNLMNVKSQLYKPHRETVPKMKALLFEPVSLELNYNAVTAPTRIFKNEVLVQVTYSGVCGTDFFITEGKVSCGDDPVILGHEISGKVYATGSGVTHVRPGDNIVVNAYSACCVCRYCSRGLHSACSNEGLNNSIGITKNGGWAEFLVVENSQVHKIPEELGLDQAALIQPLSCVLSAMSKLNILHAMSIFIQGLGLSGCLWASVLHSRGHKNVFVSDKSERKRVQFESLDTNYTFIPPEEIGKQGADVIIECTGSPLSIEKCFNILNPGGQMCFFGKPDPMTEVRCIPYEIIQKEISLLGNAGNSFRFSEAIHVATSLGHRYLDFEKLGVRTFDLEDYKEAFQMKKSGKVNKVIFKFES